MSSFNNATCFTNASCFSDFDMDSDGDGDAFTSLSESLMKLSMVDRNAIFEEIHGVRCLAVQETPELNQSSLREFQRELDRDNDGSNKKAYRVLRKRREPEPVPGFPSIDNDDFRLRFLRCELYDVPKAVLRFCNYLDYAYAYWGEVSLQRPIRLTDFTKSDVKLFRKGFFQLLPLRDSSGRRVVVFLGWKDPNEDVHAKNKCLFYLWDVVTRDSIESQQKGFITIRLFTNSVVETTSKSDGEKYIARITQINKVASVLEDFRKLLSSIPSRIVAFHIRAPESPIARHVISRFLATRTLSGINAGLQPRVVQGPGTSSLEILYWLASHGIPTQLFPLTDTDSIKCNYHNQWIQLRYTLESGIVVVKAGGVTTEHITTNDNNNNVREAAAIVECPALHDVIFRQGYRSIQMNPGNRVFRDRIQFFWKEKERLSERLWQEEVQTRKADATSACEQHEGDASNHAGASEDFFRPAKSRSEALSDVPYPTIAKTNGMAFCDWLIDYIEQECNGRFLEWNTDIRSWVVMMDKSQIRYKVSTTFYNMGRQSRKRPRSISG